MLRPDFFIHAEDLDTEDLSQCRLLIEVNHHSFSYVLLSVRGMRPVVIKYFQWNPLQVSSNTEILREILEEDPFLSSNEVNETFIVYNFADSNLVPESLFQTELGRPLANLVYGNLDKGLILAEKIPWWELHNVYRIPTEVHRLIQQKFLSGKFWHFYSLQLKCHKMFNARETDQYLRLFFYGDKMILIALLKGQPQLVQTFNYLEAKDVAYHLLNTCQQLNLDQEQVVVDISGLIEKQSSLYAELQKYFLHVNFEGMEDSIKVTDELREFPLHYFSSLLKMAVCV